jgi:hypothetical protein
MRFRLRALLILLAVGPPILAGVWSAYRGYCEHQPNEPWDMADVRSGALPMVPAQR